MMHLKITPLPRPFECQYCGKSFVKEATLTTHICEAKRRAMAKSEKHVVLGYDTYNRFFKKTQNIKGNKTYEDFAKSPYYNAFVKFGSFVSNVAPLYPDRFIDFVITSGVKLDHWCRDELYDQYVLDLIKNESVETALERSINHMISWAETNNSLWNHYFKYVSTNRATYDIKDGKVSPWLVLNCAEGKALLQKLSDEQLESLNVIIDVPFWVNKFKRNPEDVKLVRKIVKESNL